MIVIEFKFIGHCKMDNEEMAKYLSVLVSGGASDQVPYKSVDYDAFNWTLDVGNNWFLNINDDVFRITYRYQCEKNQHEEALFNWLKVLLNIEQCNPPS